MSKKSARNGWNLYNLYGQLVTTVRIDLQKKNGLLSKGWASRSKGFLNKTGRGRSRDAVITIFKMKFKDFLVMVSLDLLDLGYIFLKKTLH